MDTTLVKTFIEVVACDSFAGAAERLFVSQSAVSLRIQSLEAQLGRKVFLRSKTGITLTPAGKQFERYAYSFLQVWEEAKQQVAIPDDYEDVLVIAGEYDMWSRLLIRWLPTMAEYLPHVAFRAEVAHHQRLTRHMIEGTIDIAVMYTPQIRPGIIVDTLFEDEVVMVSTNPQANDIDEHYVFVDWGVEFAAFHATHFPDYKHPRLTFGVGPIALAYLLNNGGSAYMAKRLIEPHLDEGNLFLVEEMPVFSFPVHVSWRDQIKPQLIHEAVTYLRSTAQQSLDNDLPSPFWVNDKQD